MRNYKHARINKISNIIGVIVCFLSTFVQGAYTGFLAGSSFCEVKYPIIAGGWWSHLDPYFSYFDRQRFITFFILIFLVGKLFKNKWISHPICLISIIFPIYSILETIYYKNKFWDESDKYLRLARELFNYEGTIALMLFTLFILEIVLIVQNFQAKQE